jgi:hypothetical protein
MHGPPDTTARRTLVRNVEASGLFETFLVSAIAAILAIRGFLHLTGYPQIGGDSLHIAHMLWGGLLMAVATALLLGWLGGAVRRIAAVVGGVGFGTFIDEVGKFVTADNDYFFRPTFSLIYITFIMLYFAFRALHRSALTPVERVANALELTQEAVRHDLDEDEKRRALDLLAGASASDPVVRSLRDALERIAHVRAARPGAFARARNALRLAYAALVRHRLFSRSVIVITVVLAAASIFSMLMAGIRADADGLDATELAELIAHAIPAAILLAGLRHLRRSRLAMWHTFHRAILFQIVVTRVLTFYVAQLAALLGLLGDLIVLSTIRTLIQQEENLVRAPVDPAEAKAAAASSAPGEHVDEGEPGLLPPAQQRAEHAARHEQPDAEEHPDLS